MFLFERCCRTLRNAPGLRRLDPLWNALRPGYETLLRCLYPCGLKRLVNGTDVVYVSFDLRHYTETYEPACWKRLMSRVRPGDIVADVGAFIGFYSFAFCRRVGPGGRVVAFEPDSLNHRRLCAARRFYPADLLPEMVHAAVGDADGFVAFRGCGSPVSAVSSTGGPKVRSVILDNFFRDSPLDILKIDVEGYEARVLAGCRSILARGSRAPRMICVEMHPYAWEAYGCDAESVIVPLLAAGYTVTDVRGEPVSAVKEYCTIFAERPA